MFEKLPEHLPAPKDDGACNHLLYKQLPDVLLRATNDEVVNPAKLSGRVVIYCYPMTGRPGDNLPEGWDTIPGARGCTPQSCSFRDQYKELKNLNSSVFGLSTQKTEYQKEAKARLHLPFELLSDADLLFQKGLDLPVFKVENITLLKRLTIIADDGKIIKHFYPVFPPDKNIQEVINWLLLNKENAV